MVLKHAALHKMLNDYRLQRFRSAYADAFRLLIAETEIELGSSKMEKGARIASLKKQDSDD